MGKKEKEELFNFSFGLVFFNKKMCVATNNYEEKDKGPSITSREWPTCSQIMYIYLELI